MAVFTDSGKMQQNIVNSKMINIIIMIINGACYMILQSAYFDKFYEYNLGVTLSFMYHRFLEIVM